MDRGRPQLNKNEHEVVINYKDVRLNGILSTPSNPVGLIIFAHGSGSSRWSPRNNFVARELQKVGLATLLTDLLTPEEENDRANVFDISTLAQRLTIVKKWAQSQAATRNLAIGYFGASTGAGAALVAAAQDPDEIFAVVSRGGRPDLAAEALDNVQAPTLLIIGGDDTYVIELNQIAYDKLMCKKEMKIIPGATHLFEEPGTLEKVAILASDWFTKNLKYKESARPQSLDNY
nr:hypothetical protein HAGR004_10680 [Bdellovibrio sp. HAGR004]